jgi:HK97 family phage portal protein
MLRVLRHPRAGGWGLGLLNRTSVNYAGLVQADANSIVQACIRWAQRNFSEAPPILEQWNADRQDWDQHYRHELLGLLRRPNPYYSGTTLFKAVIADLMVGDGGGGNAYILKLRSASGRTVQLWWAPAHLMEPKSDDDGVFITHYEYRPGGGAGSIALRVQDVIHFRDGMDPANPRKGMAPMKSLFREIFTDDEAANMTASLLGNLGVPGLIIVPSEGRIPRDVATYIQEQYQDRYTGDKRGTPLVLEGAARVEQFGFSPEQMQLRSLRGIPEERITALIGINAAVLGLGAGLSTTKVGATLREYREEATESFMVPLWHELGEELTRSLLPDFEDGDDWRLVFDLSKVRVLQEDVERRAESLGKRLEAGGITVAEYRRALGMVVKPEHEVYLRRAAVVPVPAGLSPDEQAERARTAKVETVRESEVEAAVAAAMEVIR